MSYKATVQDKRGNISAVTVTAEDYTKAYLMIAYALPLTTIIIELKEDTKNVKF